MCTSSVSNVIYHKFSHGTAFYTLNGKNVNVMLEFLFLPKDMGLEKPESVQHVSFLSIYEYLNIHLTN